MKHGKHVLIMGLVGVIIYGVAFFGESAVLDTLLVPAAGVTITAWLDDFKNWAGFIMVTSTAMSLIWFVITAGSEVVDWRNIKNYQRLWWILPSPVVILVFISISQSYAAQEFAWLAHLFHLLNGLLCYYLATVLNTPSSFKYIPPGATKLRRW